jgi:hypothetical protein
MKKLLATIAVLSAIATPSFAQYYPQDYQAAVPPSSQHKGVARHNGANAFAMVPRASAGSTLDDPSLTGGGSTGYNVLLRTY